MPTLQEPEDGYGWKNYLVNACVDTLQKILVLKLELLDITTYMVRWEL